jgi:hypothetical protein
MKIQNGNLSSHCLFKDALLSILADKFHSNTSVFLLILKKLYTIKRHIRSVTEILCIHIMILNDIKASN